MISCPQIPMLKSQADYTIVDCPANASEMNRAIIFALTDEDKLLIPVKPTSVDKIASNPTLRLIKQASLHGKKFKAGIFFSNKTIERKLCFGEDRVDMKIDRHG